MNNKNTTQKEQAHALKKRSYSELEASILIVRQLICELKQTPLGEILIKIPVEINKLKLIDDDDEQNWKRE